MPPAASFTEVTDMKNERYLSHSQNFLRDPGFVSFLIGKTDISPDDLVVEIGPGRGIITRQLAKRGCRVIAVEVDQNLADNLRKDLVAFPKVMVIIADFLDWSLPIRPYKVFANIPFNMTADIIFRLTGDVNHPQVAYLIMQEEAAGRFIGRPIANESQASILLEPWFEVRIVVKIGRRQFSPVPKVNAALVSFRKREIPLVRPEMGQWFKDLVVYGYNQWQPTTLEAFSKIFTLRQRLIIAQETGIEKSKPTDLTIDQWIKLFNIFISHVTPEKKEIVRGAEQRLKTQQVKLQKWHRTR